MRRVILAASIFSALLFGQEFKVGTRVSDFRLKDVNGADVRLDSLRGDVTVIAFIATKCPVSNAYNGRMKALYDDYAPKGVKFVFINSNSTEPAAEVAGHTKANGFPFAVYKDDDNVVADRFGATVTPELFILDKSGVIAYHGSIDDSQEISRVKTERARNALDQVLEGRPVEPAETKAFGCTIKRIKKTS
jgi:peroxiredoxin